MIPALVVVEKNLSNAAVRMVDPRERRFNLNNTHEARLCPKDQMQKRDSRESGSYFPQTLHPLPILVSPDCSVV